MEILLADGYPMMFRIIGNQLIENRVTHTLTTASDGLKAIDRINESNFDVIIADTGIPKFDGFELLQYLRAKEIDTAFIMVFPQKETRTHEAAYAFGANACLQKPFSGDELTTALRTVCSR